WTVNGELRVGVFARRPIFVGEEFTLDYQFQRYGREAQKCFCGSAICSGYIGGEKQISIDAYSGVKSSTAKRKKGSDDKKREWEDLALEEEIEKLNSVKGLRNREETLKFARLMVRAEESSARHQLLDIIICSVTSPSEGISEPVCKKLKNVEISDSETDSNGSHNTNENASETSTLNENFKAEILKSEMSPSPVTEIKSPSDFQDSKTELKEDDPQYGLKKSILSRGADLLSNWKNLKEVFRIPRLEQQKRKEDELEADHHMMSVCAKTEEKKPEVVEFTGDQIQVLISVKTPSFSDNIRTFEYDNPDINYKMDDRSRNNLLQVPQSNNKMKKRHFIPKSKMEDLSQRKLKEDSDSSLEGASPSLSGTSPIIQPSSRPALLPTPTFVNQPPVNFPPPINPSVAPHPHLDQAPPTMYPPPMVYPPSQVPFVNTGAPPPVLTHPPTSIPPPTAVIPQPAPILQHPPNTSIPPVNTGLPPNPNTFQLPPNMPPASAVPASAPFIPSQNPAVPNYPPGPNPFGNQGQPFYFMQQPPAIPNAPQAENMGVQSAPPMSVQPVNSMHMPPTSFPLPSTTSLPPTSSLPMQVPTSLPVQSSMTLLVQTTESVSKTTVSVVKEEPKPVKLPKLWRSATDSEGNVYYYHSVTRQTQWDPPSMDEAEEESEDEDEDSESEESESSDTPTYDEPKVSNKHVKRKPKKRKTTKAAADTSVSITVRPEVAKKIKELFRTKMSSYIVHCLNSYRKPDCKVGRITCNEDFKYLARK
ncbi:Histone-lysine N-methyltransferase SETD2, partial [Araneus ventricosus]